MAAAAGIEMSDCSLLEEGPRAHFMTRRFDRPGVAGDRLHMQTLCALVGADYNEVGAHDYATLFLAADELDLGQEAMDQLFRRVCFNVLASNNDDHTKNHSFLRDREGNWRLSPAYDLTYAYRADNRWLRQHLMSVNGKFEGIDAVDLLVLADQFQVADARGILREVRDTVGRWRDFAAAAGLGEDRTALVAHRIREVRESLG